MSAAAPTSDDRIHPVRDFRPLLPCLRRLTRRQNEVLHWLCEGKPRGLIAAILDIAEKTVECHLQVIYAALGVDNAHGAVAAIYHADMEALEKKLKAQQRARTPRK